MTDEEYCTFEEQFARLEICKTCENYHENENTTTSCLGCNCSLSLLITFKNQTCPLGKW